MAEASLRVTGRGRMADLVVDGVGWMLGFLAMVTAGWKGAPRVVCDLETCWR